MPRGTHLGRNVKVGERVRAVDFGSRTVKSGGTVDRKATPRGADHDGNADEPSARASAAGRV